MEDVHLIRQVAAELVHQRGMSAAFQLLYEQAELFEAMGDLASARTSLDIANTLDEMLSQPPFSPAPPSP